MYPRRVLIPMPKLSRTGPIGLAATLANRRYILDGRYHGIGFGFVSLSFDSKITQIYVELPCNYSASAK